MADVGHVYRWISGRTIDPFGDAPGEVRVLNRPLRERQDEACSLAGLGRPEEITSLGEIAAFPAVVFHDYVYFTRTLLEDFVRAARAQAGSTRCGIAPSVFVEATASLQDLDPVAGTDGAAAYDLWHLGAAVADEDALRALPCVLVDPRESVEEPRLPPQFINDATPTRVAVTSRQALHVTHWALILRVNLGAFVATLKDLWERRPVYIAMRFLMDKLLGRWRRVRLSRVGKGCQIHPTAVVEGSWLGDGVKVGAGAIVQASVIGDGAIIEEGAILNLSILGHRAWIGRKSVLFMTVTYDEVFVGHRLTQACLLGHRVCTTGGGFLIDMNFDGPVKVRKDGGLVDAGTNFLGVCLGHDVTLGTGIWIGGGREVPNGAFVIRDPEQLALKFPEKVEPGDVMIVRRGRVEPVEPK